MKIVLFANTDWYLYNFRIPLLQALKARGDEPVLISSPGPYRDKLAEQGFRCIPFQLSRSGINPLTELKIFLRLIRLYRDQNPEVFVHFTIKCVIYGSLAARLLGKKVVINSIDGLGYVFTSTERKAHLLRIFVKPLMRRALKKTFIIFQNPDDQDAFLRMKMVRKRQYALIRGVGIDVSQYTLQQHAANIPVVLYGGRLLYSKGVEVFVKTARQLKSEGISARFVLVGKTDPGNPESIADSTIDSWVREGVIEYWGWRDDMPSVYQDAHIFCLPTISREGLPKALMEASASGLPIIASDVPGCREIVSDEINGLLVPPGDVHALAAGLRRLILDADLRQEMGRRGREIVEQNFSAEQIVRETLDVIERHSDLHRKNKRR